MRRCEETTFPCFVGKVVCVLRISLCEVELRVHWHSIMISIRQTHKIPDEGCEISCVPDGADGNL